MEQLYAILPIEKLNEIDWNKTFQTEDTARFNIDRTLFVISKMKDSDYLSEENWISHLDVHQIVSSDEFSGIRPSEV